MMNLAKGSNRVMHAPSSERGPFTERRTPSVDISFITQPLRRDSARGHASVVSEGSGIAHRCVSQLSEPTPRARRHLGHVAASSPRISSHRRAADDASEIYYTFLERHGGLTLGWTAEEHDWFLQIALRVQRASSDHRNAVATERHSGCPFRQEGPTLSAAMAGATPQSTCVLLRQEHQLPPAEELRERAVEALGHLIPIPEVERHVHLYLRYLELVRRRKLAIEAFHRQREALAAEKKQLAQWRQRYEIEVAGHELQAKESRRLKRQAQLKQQVERWRQEKNAAAQEAEKQQQHRLRREAHKVRAVVRVGDPAATPVMHPSLVIGKPSTEVGLAGELQRRERHEAACRQREELQRRWTTSRLIAQRRRQAVEKAIQSEKLTTKNALCDRLHAQLVKASDAPSAACPSSARARYYDPTICSILRGATPREEGGEVGRDAWMDAGVQSRLESAATVHSVLYRQHRAAPSWCGPSYQK